MFFFCFQSRRWNNFEITINVLGVRGSPLKPCFVSLKIYNIALKIVRFFFITPFSGVHPRYSDAIDATGVKTVQAIGPSVQSPVRSPGRRLTVIIVRPWVWATGGGRQRWNTIRFIMAVAAPKIFKGSYFVIASSRFPREVQCHRTNWQCCVLSR